MSDLEFSASESDPVSDVNPEEMARLMADIDDMDDDLFKSNKKSSGKGGGDGEKETRDASRKVTFKDSAKQPGKSAKVSDDDDDAEDWDADDLLYSDDEIKTRKAPPKKPESKDSSLTPQKNKPDGVSRPASTTNIDRSPVVDNKTDVSKSPGSKKDKSKLMDELFGDDDEPVSSMPKSTPKAGMTGGRGEGKKTRGKSKDDVTFDDDDDDLLGDYGDRRKKAATSPKSNNFLSSLLVKSPSTEGTKREKPTDFVLDERYKRAGNSDKENKESAGSYMPSANKRGSPRRKSPGKPVGRNSTDLDLLDSFDSQPRRRNPPSASHRKPFELDDDDILGNIRSRKGAKKDISQETSPTQPSGESKKSTPGKSGKKDEWLFGSSEEMSSANRAADKSPVAKSPSNQESGEGAKDDWLGSLLTIKKQPQETEEPTKEIASVSPPKSAHTRAANLSPSMVQFPGGVIVETPPTVAPAIIPPGPQIGDGDGRPPVSPGFSYTTPPQPSAPQIQQIQLQQKQQLEMQMAQQLQHQQQLMAEAMKKQMEDAQKRYQENLLSLQQTSVSTVGPAITSNETQKSLEVELRIAEMEVERLKAELEVVRRQHKEEVDILEEGCRRKLDVEREVWGRVESRLREERDGLLTDFHSKIATLQAEKESLGSSYNTQLSGVRTEWQSAVERTKELYSGMVTRMKEEHQAALDRLTHLKELELKAALSASGHVKEAEAVMTQLESNTTNLSQLTAAVNTQHDSALQLTQRALKVKEKQLQDSESEMAASRAEMESERGRLNILIHRLENTLTQQGSEIEKERWRLAQERMKVEVERQSLTEERKHLQMSTETERQSLCSARDTLMSEHRAMLQAVAHQKQDVAAYQARITLQQKRATSVPIFKHDNINLLEMDHEGVMAGEEQHLRERLAAVSRQQYRLKEEEACLDQLSLQLEQEKTKVRLEKEMIEEDRIGVNKTRAEVDKAREEIDQLRVEQQQRLDQITAQTRALHNHQDKIDNEKLRLQRLREELVRLTQKGLCISCQTNGGGGGGVVAALIRPSAISRVPGDGGEGGFNKSLSWETSSRIDMSPASVMARLAAAREQQNADREKRLLQLSALEYS